MKGDLAFVSCTGVKCNVKLHGSEGGGVSVGLGSVHLLIKKSIHLSGCIDYHILLWKK